MLDVHCGNMFYPLVSEQDDEGNICTNFEWVFMLLKATLLKWHEGDAGRHNPQFFFLHDIKGNLFHLQVRVRVLIGFAENYIFRGTDWAKSGLTQVSLAGICTVQICIQIHAKLWSRIDLFCWSLTPWDTQRKWIFHVIEKKNSSLSQHFSF